MACYRPDDPAKAAEHAESVAPCGVSVWRTADGAVLFVVGKVGSYSSDEAKLLDGRCVDSGERADTVRTWTEETAATYRGTPCWGVATRRPGNHRNSGDLSAKKVPA